MQRRLHERRSERGRNVFSVPIWSQCFEKGFQWKLRRQVTSLAWSSIANDVEVLKVASQVASDPRHRGLEPVADNSSPLGAAEGQRVEG